MGNPAPSIWTIGVDTGQKGALAAVSNAKSIVLWDLPLQDGKLWGTQFRDYIRMLGTSDKIIRLAVIEKNNAMPPRSKFGQPVRKAGAQSSFNFGEMQGEARGVCIGLGIPVANVPASVWKKHYGLSHDKALSVLKACALFPEYEMLFEGPRGGIKDGRAEAVLLAQYGQRMVLP